MDADAAPKITETIMVLGDSHGDRPYVRDALRLAAAYGARRVVSVGDFGIWPGSSGKMFLDTVDRMAADRDVDVYVVPGNHDDYDQIHSSDRDDAGWHVLRARIRAAPRPHVWEWSGVTFLGFGGSASIDGPGGAWAQVRGPVTDPETARRLALPVGHDLGGWWTQERITAGDVDAVRRVVAGLDGPVDVMVTHEVPVGVHMGEGDDGAWPVGVEQRDLVRQAVDVASPRHVLCGHWHRFRQELIPTAAGCGATVIALSADVNPAEPQYAWLHIERDGRTHVDVPAPWNVDADALPRGGGWR